MKPFSALIIFIWFCSSCKETTPITYQDAIDDCWEVVRQENLKDTSAYDGLTKDCVMGSLIPEINSNTTSGLKIDKNYFAGKPGLINFWFEACVACVAEIPHLNQLVDSLGTDRFYFLTIGRDPLEQIEVFLADHPWKFDHIVNGKDLLKSSFQNPFAYPNSFLINRDGKIVQSYGFITENILHEVISDLKSLL